MPPYWIIEHRNRGTFVGFDTDRRTGEWRPHFRWSGLRTDPDTERFWSKKQAEKELAKISETVKGCYILAFPAKH